jgi:hypothetical protein
MIMDPIHSIATSVGVTMVELPAARLSQILASPQAQLKTARYKKAVYLSGELVFKGPYRGKEPALINNLQFNYAIELLETALQLHQSERGTLPWEFLGYAGDDRYYLAAPNVGRRGGIPFEVVNSKIETNATVVRRKGAVERVSDLEGTERLTPDVKAAALQNLYLRFLFDIGDSGTHNILVRQDYQLTGRLVAGIDLEERRAFKEKARRLDHLFKKPPSKKQVRLYESDVCKIKPLTDRQLDQRTSDALTAIGIDVRRLIERMRLWESSN